MASNLLLSAALKHGLVATTPRIPVVGETIIWYYLFHRAGR